MFRNTLRTSIYALICMVIGVCSVSRAAVINVPGDQPTIAAAIAAAVSGDEIVVAPGTYFESGLNPLGKNILIRSSGGAAVTTINGSGLRIFQIDSNETAAMGFQGFTFTGGASNSGGAGFIGGSSPTFRDCVFTGNSSTGAGGALTISVGNFAGTSGTPSSPLFVNCTFSNNVSSGTGATARGGAVNISGAWPTFRNCSFTGNSQARTGGAVGIAANALFSPPGNPPVVFENCTFSGNICNPTNASHGGGPALHVNSRSVTLTDCTISNHTTTSTFAVGALGLVMAGTGPQTATLTRTTFSNNHASAAPAASRPIILVVTSATVNIDGGGFTNNGFRLSDGVELGFNTGINFTVAAGTTTALNISNASFTGNSTSATTPTGNTALIFGSGNATVGSGGLTTTTITNTTFSNNEISAVYFAGGASSASITGGSISGNIGGAGMIVANPIGSLSINGTAISNNSGLIAVSGATSPSSAGTFTITNATFSANSGTVTASNFANAAITGGSFGSHTGVSGLVNLRGSGTSAVSGVSFASNSLRTTSPTSSLKLVEFTGESGAGSGTISNCTFNGNTGVGSSNALLIASDLASLQVNGLTFTNNILTGSGSAIASLSAIEALTVSGSSFDCASTSALLLSDTGGTISGCDFRNCEGAVEASSAASANLSVINSTFFAGTSNGGSATGVLISDAINAAIRNSRFLGNNDGAISLAGTGTHSIVNTLIAGSAGNGGAIALGESSSTTIANCTLFGNLTGASGAAGGVSIIDSANATVINTISYGNSAPEIDGAATTGIVDVTFSNVQGGFIGTGNIDAAPLFVDADGSDNTPNTIDDDYRLTGTSPGINSGSNAGVPVGVTTDLGGQARIASTTVDIGAYEFQAPACRADFNNNSLVEVADIFAFLAAWFAGDTRADFNGNNANDVPDIFGFLAAWFAGCP